MQRRRFLKLSCASAAALLAPGMFRRLPGAEPGAVPLAQRTYPPFASRAACQEAAIAISRRLDAHITAWLDGRGPAEIPDELLPTGMDRTLIRGFRLMRVEDLDPDQLWVVREAAPVDQRALRHGNPDPHCTYLINVAFFAPFGHTAVVEGEFPRCRYFAIQTAPPFSPDAFRYAGWAGATEVSFADVDIEPLPGHVNPFRVGADRTATNRSFRVEVPLVVSDVDPGLIESSLHPPAYRASGNRRFGSALAYQGPWGSENPGHQRGPFDIGQLWIRAYAPDLVDGRSVPVAKPKLSFRTADGRAYAIVADISRFVVNANEVHPARVTWSEEPRPGYGFGPDYGWGKMMGIARGISIGVYSFWGWPGAAEIRQTDLEMTNRGEDQPGINGQEQSATTCCHISYFGRGVSIGHGKVMVLVGRLPRTPMTRDGATRMTAGEARYFSITGVDPATPTETGYAGAATHSIMDDEFVLDAERRYVVVYSRAEDRPANATAANGVTWVEWGPTATQSLVIRWMSVLPDWSFALTPSEDFIGWNSNFPSVAYDQRLIGENHHRGALLDHLPRAHYLTREQFAALGTAVTAERIPRWATAPDPLPRTVQGQVRRAGGGALPAGLTVSDGVHQTHVGPDGTFVLQAVAGSAAVRVRPIAGWRAAPQSIPFDTSASDVRDVVFTLEPDEVQTMEVELSGQLQAGLVSLTIGDLPARPTADGRWSVRRRVPSGTTVLPAVARDAEGKPATRTITLDRPAKG